MRITHVVKCIQFSLCKKKERKEYEESYKDEARSLNRKTMKGETTLKHIQTQLEFLKMHIYVLNQKSRDISYLLPCLKKSFCFLV